MSTLPPHLDARTAWGIVDWLLSLEPATFLERAARDHAASVLADTLTADGVARATTGRKTRKE